MLQSIRERATGWIAWVIVGLISIPFALWGINEYFGPDPNPPVAKVNGAVVDMQRFEQAFSQQRQALREALGGRLDEAEVDLQALRDRTLEQMIAEEALLQAALGSGLRIADAQIAATIRNETTFIRDGVFSQQAYEAWLRSQGMSAAGFEQRLRRQLLAEQLLRGIGQTAFVPASAGARLDALVRQTRSFQTLRLSLAPHVDEQTPDAAAVEAYYREHAAEFALPERVVVEYVLLSRGALAAEVEVDEQALRQRYEAEKANFAMAEQRRVSHVLVQVDPDADAAAVDAARQRIEDARARIVDGGEDFAAVAAETSEDPGSAAQGGDLGLFARGVMDPAFEAAAFAQAEGQLGEPVRTDFGFHLIKVTEVRGGSVKPYEEMESQLRATAQAERAEQLFFEEVERLANLVFEVPDSLEPAADTLGLEIRVSNPFSRDGDSASEIFSQPSVVRAAFSEDVMRARNNSQPVDLGDGRVVALRVREVLPEALQTLEEARAAVERRLRREMAETALREQARALLAKLREGDAPEDVAAEASAEWRMHDGLRRDATDVDAEVLDTVFRLPRPAPAAPVFDATETRAGDLVVVVLQRVGEAAQDTARTAQLRQAVALGRGQQEFAGYTEGVRARADVTIYRETLNRLL